MSIEIWPPISPAELKTAEEDTQRRELEWLLDELHETLQNLKHGLEHCYALLAPLDPGSTLVVSTPRNELVKGHVTRVGTRIVKGTLQLRMRTQPPLTLAINPEHPIHIAPLTSLHTLLTQSIDLLDMTLKYTYPPSASSTPAPPLTSAHLPPSAAAAAATSSSSSSSSSNAAFVAAQLRLLAQSVAEASALLKGPQPLTASDARWRTQSCAPAHFLAPRPGAGLSVHWGVQDGSLVLWLRALEPARAPVNLGMKFALAIGTARRLEHDEADQEFTYAYPEGYAHAEGGGGNGGGDDRSQAEVFVREKVRVESADPSLLSLSAKLGALGHTLALARRNLAAVMGEELDE